MSRQTGFALPLLRPELPIPCGLKTWNNSDPAVRYAVYRNNVTVSLIDALASTFSVVKQLVGEVFFHAMARLFVQEHPPQSRVMALYGDGFAEFIENFAPAASVPYLADVARLEMAYVFAFHAGDATTQDTTQLQALLAAPMQLEKLKFSLHPSVHILRAPYAIVSIWAAHQTGVEPLGWDASVAQNALVFRHQQSVHIQSISDEQAFFMISLLNGETLLKAADQAAARNPAFDLQGILVLLLGRQLLIVPTTRDCAHGHPN